MKELGESKKRFHYEVGALLLSNGIKRLFGFGELTKESVNAFGDGAKWYSDFSELINDLKEADNKTNILVKGSRSMRMELIVKALKLSETDKSEI